MTVLRLKHLVLGTATCCAMAAFPAASWADYPERAIELLVPAPAGGGTDTSARKLAILLEEKLGVSLAVLNVGGGGGSVGITQFMQAKPHGYQLLATWNSPLTTVPQVQPVAYSLDDLTPIASTSETAYTLCVKPDFPAASGQEFLAILAENPGKYTYGNDGIGGTMQLAAERIFQKKGIEAVPIPFGGAGETLQNFLGGHVDIYGGSISPVLPYVQNGEAKCLVVTSADSVPALPDAAGLAELGLADEETLLWRAIFGAKDMDPARVETLAKAISEAVQDPSYVAFLEGQGEVPNVVTGTALRDRVQAEYEALAAVAKTLGLSN